MIATRDGFCMVYKSVSDILATANIQSVPDSQGQMMQCRQYFDDWFLYAVCTQVAPVYGLFKMREQEHEKEQGIQADGDTPGVTISFISFDPQLLKRCLQTPSEENRKNLGAEINRVVAYTGQRHHPVLKAYFVRPEAEASYWIADLYTDHIVQFFDHGVLAVPAAYTEIYGKRNQGKRYARIPDFLDQNNRDAGTVVCDHSQIVIRNSKQLTRFEKLAILATHTGNVSYHSFAAEVRYHAMFLTDAAKIKIPLVGSPYASAIRADMSIGDKEFQGPTPYYDLSGKLVQEQKNYHTDR